MGRIHAELEATLPQAPGRGVHGITAGVLWWISGQEMLGRPL